MRTRGRCPTGRAEMLIVLKACAGGTRATRGRLGRERAPCGSISMDLTVWAGRAQSAQTSRRPATARPGSRCARSSEPLLPLAARLTLERVYVVVLLFIHLYTEHTGVAAGRPLSPGGRTNTLADPTQLLLGPLECLGLAAQRADCRQLGCFRSAPPRCLSRLSHH